MHEQDPADDVILRALGEEQRHADAASVQVPSLEDEAGLLDAVFDRVDAPAEAETQSQSRPPTPLSRRRNPAAWVVPLVAIAAALALWLGLRPAEAIAPPYAVISLEAGRAEIRGADEPNAIALSSDDAITMTLAPESAVETAPAVAVIARARGRATARRPATGLQVDISGSVRIDATLADLATVEPGPLTLEICPADDLPSDGAEAPTSHPPTVAVVPLSVLVVSGT